MITKSGVLKGANEGVYTFILSTEQLDRQGEKMTIAGIDIENFKSNPQCFFNHDSFGLPIATWENIRKDGGELIADLRFSEDIEESAKIKKYVDEGFIKAVSVGFQSHETKKEPFPSGMKKAGYKDYITNHVKSELLEASLVTIPANPGAVRIKDMKAGAVLSAKNKSNLVQAQNLIQSVLDGASPTDPAMDNNSDDNSKDYEFDLTTKKYLISLLHNNTEV